jgi:plastocyanin
MTSFRRAACVVTFLGVFFFSTLARAGDVKGKVSEEGLRSAENIAVYIDAVPGKKFDRPPQHLSIDQRNMRFIPYVRVVLRGSTVDFLNSDKVAHNVYWSSISGNKRFAHNLTIVSPGQSKSFEFDELGTAKLLCNLHPEMLGYVVVVPTPYFALTSSDGTFEIKNVPAGNYTLKTWSEEGKPTTQAITVTDGTANVEIIVKK